jgi:hypothetical protein
MAINRNSGFSVMEMIVAISIATMISLGAVSFFNTIDQQGRKAGSFGDCSEYLKESFASIEQIGSRGLTDHNYLPKTGGTASYTALAYSLPTPLDPYLSIANPGFPNPSDYNVSLGTLVFAPTNSYSTELNSPVMLVGTTHFLHSIIRANPSVCSTAQTYDKFTVGTSRIFPPPGKGLTETGDFQASIKLIPSSGVACTNPLQVIASKGMQNTTALAISTPPTTTFGPNIVRGASINADIKIAYTKKGESSQTVCEETRTYRYPADTTPPTAPTSVIFTLGGTSSCDISPTGRNRDGPHFVKINYSSFKPGITLFCRDRSFSFQNNHTCNPAYLYGAFPTPNQWTACEAVTVCGYSRNVAADSTPQVSWPSMQQTLKFDRLPYGCRIQLDVVAVDPAGNYSTPVTLTSDITPP